MLDAHEGRVSQVSQASYRCERRCLLLLINCAFGLNTPPVGTVQFVGCAIGGISVGAVMRTILPFYAALIAALLLVTYVPAFSLLLPRLWLGYTDEYEPPRL
jgi:Tripartite ATP-independent periplasmic transporter, DctM component